MEEAQEDEQSGMLGGKRSDAIACGETKGPSSAFSPARAGPGKAWKVVAACSGFMADSYDLYSIDLVLVIFDYTHPDEFGVTEKSLVVSIMLVGVVIGQLTFGFIADIVGRKWAFVTTAVLMTASAAASALVCETDWWFDMPVQLAACRFLLGLGVGGEYPLSATVMAETAEDPQTRARFMALVISMQGVGMMLSSLLAVAALYLGASLDFTWRLLLGFGAVPSLVAFILRFQMHETEAYTALKKGEDSTASTLVKLAETIRQYSLLLVGTAGCWLLMNVFQYSVASFKSSTMLLMMPPGGEPREVLMAEAQFAVITAAVAIVGFAVGHVNISVFSRFTMQLYGFLAIAVTFFTAASLTAGNPQLGASVLVALLCFMFFFMNAGPNVTTYILPGEIFPTRARAACHGISAASGKMGAVIGTAMLLPLEDAKGLVAVHLVCGGSALLAACLTWGFTPRCSVDLAALDGSSTLPISSLPAGRLAKSEADDL